MFVLYTITFAQNKDVKEAKGLSVGDKAPLFEAIDADSNKFELASSQKPVVMIFYRGFWCPFCNKHLEKLQDSLKYITDLGAKVVAVSPENPEYLDKMKEKTSASFTLLFDEGYEIAKKYDVNFNPPKAQLFMLNKVFGANMDESHSEEEFQLPIPATYLIDKNGVIIWKHFDPDYKKRSNVSDIIKALEKAEG